jgi:hypothetical protein
LNKCLEELNISWYDFQRNYCDILESPNEEILIGIEEENYWKSGSSVECIFRDTLEEVKRKG